MSKLKLALVGGKVENSKSELVHAFILRQFNCEVEYQKYSLTEGEFEGKFPVLLQNFDGINITTPFKEKVMEHLTVTKKSDEARSVNTVLCRERLGDTTDGDGFLAMLRYEGIETKNQRFTLVGAGGAGRSIAQRLKTEGTVFLYRRNQAQLCKDAKRLGVIASMGIQECDALVNCTGIVKTSPVEREELRGCAVAIDLHYKTQTAFLSLAKKEGKICLDGLGMLFFQAYFSDCLYLGREGKEDEAFKLYQLFLKEYKR